MTKVEEMQRVLNDENNSPEVRNAAAKEIAHIQGRAVGYVFYAAPDCDESARHGLRVGDVKEHQGLCYRWNGKQWALVLLINEARELILPPGVSIVAPDPPSL